MANCDEARKDALYDAPVFREFCWIYRGRERAPDATTLPKLRHLLEEHQPGAMLFAKVGELLMANGRRCGLDAGLTLSPMWGGALLPLDARGARRGRVAPQRRPVADAERHRGADSKLAAGDAGLDEISSSVSLTALRMSLQRL